MEEQTEPKAILPQDIEETVRQYVFNLRVRFLAPGILMLLFAVALLISMVHLHESRAVDRDLIQLQTTASNLYKNGIVQNTRALQTIMDSLSTDQELAAALSGQDRPRLLQHLSPIFENFNQHYGITHFYLSNPERVNILRVHKPGKYGDTINRQTTLLAYQDGVDHYGVELGAMGILTLRYVKPWYEKQTNKLLGFIELGMELDSAVDPIRNLLGLDVFVLVNKQYLERSSWEETAKTFGHKAHWGRFPQVAISMGTRQPLPDSLSVLIQKIDFSDTESPVISQLDMNDHHAIFIPLNDASGHHVGNLIMIKDTSISSSRARETVLFGSGLLALGSIIAVIFFYWLVGRIAKQMARNEIALKQLATHDSLTGLLNRRQFDLMLENAITQFFRYDRSISLLMIDI
ncbi:MAG: diguanylate cyclase, partial [Candidatus Sabulitectum sp.]|nr:diguanylate cyclase [Candidatus Sabulitectum sp.]